MEETESTQASEATEPSPEQLLAEVRSTPGFATFAVNANQEPVEITGFRDDPAYQDLTPTLYATPVVGVNGGDGSHATVQSKIDDNVWTPFEPPESWPSEEDFNEEGTIWNDTPATQTQVTANDTATVAANALTKY